MEKTEKIRKDMSRLFCSTEELLEPEEATIEGEIPAWICGTMVRNGPGLFDFPNDFTMNHFLDGYSLLSKFEIQNSTVRFSKKFLQSNSYKKAQVAGKPVFTEFGTRANVDVTKNPFSRFLSFYLPVEVTDNLGLSLCQMGNDIFTVSGSCYLRKINKDLETCEQFDTKKYFGTQVATAHPLMDEDGTTYNIGFSISTRIKLNVIKIPPTSRKTESKSESSSSAKEMLDKSKIIASINSRWSAAVSYVHSFGLTKNHIILVEQPFVFSLTRLASSVFKGEAAGPFRDWLEWKGDEKDTTNRFIIIEKSGKVIKTEYFSSEPFFFLHIINSFEDSETNSIVIDLLAHKSAQVLDTMNLSKLRNNIIKEIDPPRAQRFVIPIIADIKNIESGVNLISDTKKKSLTSSVSAVKNGSIIILKPEHLTETGLELPTINKEYFMQKYRYFYAAGTICENSFVNSICKVNTETKETLLWKGTEFQYPGEPIFLRNKNLDQNEEVEEDCGVILSAVTNVSEKEQDFLLFLDAKTMQELGRAKFLSHVPQAIHGLFLDSCKS